ncbi:hypothetical protein AGMMS49921_07600 [Endomicrobiia bacterium]|nr:hypothetical protein AGMMS49921_07600 [Endomicrobiia bacterium]
MCRRWRVTGGGEYIGVEGVGEGEEALGGFLLRCRHRRELRFWQYRQREFVVEEGVVGGTDAGEVAIEFAIDA